MYRHKPDNDSKITLPITPMLTLSLLSHVITASYRYCPTVARGSMPPHGTSTRVCDRGATAKSQEILPNPAGARSLSILMAGDGLRNTTARALSACSRFMSNRTRSWGHATDLAVVA